MALVHRLFGGLVCLLVLLSAVNGLHANEVAALTRLRSSFPSLLQTNPYDQYDMQDNDWGGSWTKAIADICDGADGWDIQGIHCSAGHVDAIRFSPSFGKLVGNMPTLSDLSWLTNLTTASGMGRYPDGPTVTSFFEEAFRIPSLRSVKIEIWPYGAEFPTVAFESANLTHVVFEGSIAFSFSQMSYLESVVMGKSIPDFTQFNKSTTLRSLYLGVVNSLEGISELTSLETLSMYTTGNDNPSFSNFAIPSSLKSLVIVDWPYQSLGIGDVYSQLEYLELRHMPYVQNITFLPNSLQSLNVASWSTPNPWGSFPSPCRLQEFSMYGTSGMVIPELLWNCSDLKSLSFSSLNPSILNSLLGDPIGLHLIESFSIGNVPSWPAPLNMSLAHDLLCSLPVGLKTLSLAGTGFDSLPSCVSEFGGLESLDLRTHFVPQMNSSLLSNFANSVKKLAVKIDEIGYDPAMPEVIHWQTLADRFPGLVSLSVDGTAPHTSSFPGTALTQLRMLESLYLNQLGLTGSLPADFFVKLENLKTVSLSSNKLNGTIPSGGWLNLEYLDLSVNQFSEWPSVGTPGAIHLKSLYVNHNRLVSLPPDSEFLSMENLQSLDATSNPQLTILPGFWKSGAHRLKTLDMSDCALEGTFPSPISSPFIRLVDVSGNQLCGPLPEITAPVATVSIAFGYNRFSGSIPTSWGQNFSTTAIALSNNQLRGSLPEFLVSPNNRHYLKQIILENNYFTGPLLNTSSYSFLTSVSIQGTNNTWDWCTRDPEFPPSLSYARLTLDPSICVCNTQYALFSDPVSGKNIETYCASFSPLAPGEPLESMPIRSAIIPPNETCIMLQEEPEILPANENPGCPLPSPGSSFYCDNGIWKSHGSVTQPTLTLPGSSTPGTTTIIIIEGNLTVTEGGVTFNGFESQIIVNGCIFLSDNQVTIELTPEEVEKLSKEGKISKTLLTTLSANGCFGSSDLTETKVVVTKGSGSKGCRKVKARNNESTKSSLNVVFEIDNSTCNMIIIILSVIGGILILAGAALAIGLYLRHLKFKQRGTSSG